MSGHTPGPWEVEYVIDGAFEVRHVQSDDYFVVAARNSMPSRHAEFAANARLIAAAPELLDALKALLSRAQRELADPEDVGEIGQSLAAIAKAEGR